MVKSGDALIASADVALKATKEELSLILDVASPEDPKVKSHGEITISGRRSPWSGTISAPKDTKKFQEFADALSALAPVDSTMEENTPGINRNMPL